MTLRSCPTCNGLGYRLHVGYAESCAGCNGRGSLIRSYRPCTPCKRTGKINGAQCRRCKGSGYETVLTKLDREPVRIPISELRRVWTDLLDAPIPEELRTDLTHTNDYISLMELVAREEGVSSLEGADGYSLGVLAGLYTLLTEDSRLLRTLSDDGVVELDGTGVWHRDEEGIGAKILEYPMESI